MAGIACALLFPLAVFALLRLPGGNDKNRDIAAYYADRGHRTTAIVGMYALALAGLLFLWFLAALWLRLRAAEGARAGLSIIALGGGLLMVAMLYVGGAATGAIPASISPGGESQAGADLARPGWIAAWAFFLSGMFAASAAMIATSLRALRAAVFPRWFAWLGLAFAALLILVGWFYLPMILFAVWVLVASVLLLRGRAGAPGAAARA